MSEKYTFEFRGTMEEFLDVLDAIPAYRSNFGGKKHYSFDRYIVEIIDGELRFGVNRAGYSGGYWYIPTVTRYPDRVVFCGEICYIADPNRKELIGIGERVWIAFWMILLSPLLLISALCKFVKRVVCKVFRLPNKSDGERKRKLNDLMQRHLHCTEQNASN